MQAVFETIKRVAPFNTTVLITGESGTGKELVAKALHSNSPRAKGSFVAVNCGAIPETLIESELFGHKRGSFTDATRDKPGLFEEANGGTLFLDEIGDLKPNLQVKILRAIQERKIRRVGDEQQINIDVRIVAATLRNLEKDIKSGHFREDLFYRLNVITIHLDPLRTRPEDLSVLVDHFVKYHSKRLGLTERDLPSEIFERFKNYAWPGNIRELENCIERVLVLSNDSVVLPESLPEQILSFQNSASKEDSSFVLKEGEQNLSIKQHTRDLEIELITRALKRTKGNRTHAAKILDLSHRALLYKIKEYGL